MTPNNSENSELIGTSSSRWRTCHDLRPISNCTDKAVKNAIVNTHRNFFTTDPDKLIDMAEALVSQNPIVHHLAFASMSQNENEPIQNNLVCLRAIALDSNFTYPSCEHDLSDIYIKDQLIRQIASDTFQDDLLAKVGTLKSLEQNACQVEAFKSALRVQTSMASTSDIAIAWMSTYRRWKNTQQINKGNLHTSTYPNYDNSNAVPSHQAFVGCGSHKHCITGTGSYQLKCPARGQTCSNCGKPNHLPRVYQAKKSYWCYIQACGCKKNKTDEEI